MKTIASLLSILFICTTSLSAHNSISGTITDNYGNAIYYTTVVLFDIEDSNVVKMVATDIDGNYVFEDIEDGEYYIEANMLSHIPTNSEDFSFPKNNNDVIDLTLEVNEVILPLIEVVAEKPQANTQKIQNETIRMDKMAAVDDKLIEVMKRIFEDILVAENNTMSESNNICNQKAVKVCCEKK